ncbi:MAG: hypothetical protein ACSHW7_10005 [Patiriisocius sp.]|uniref:hypothetical protein n=1 Tax=Patiriisocius sp. TaxID=2822396 RepID=UPI003EF093EC
MLFKKHYKIILFVLGLTLLASSIYVHWQRDFFTYRMLRAIVSFVFLAYLCYIHRVTTSKLLALFFLLFGASSLLSIWYELPEISEIMLGLNFLSYMSLILYLKPKIIIKRMNGFYWIVFLLLISVNAYLLFELAAMIMYADGSKRTFVFLIVSSIGVVCMGMTTLLYNFTQSTAASLVFTVAVFALIFAEVFRAIGYYDFAYGNVAVYIARILLILSSALLVHYTVIHDTEKNPRIKNLI